MWKSKKLCQQTFKSLTWTVAGTFWLLMRVPFYLNVHGFVFLFLSLSPNKTLSWFSGSLMMTFLAARRYFTVNCRKISFIIVRKGDTIPLISCLPSDPNCIIHYLSLLTFKFIMNNGIYTFFYIGLEYI